ncbi:UPF0182 family membrane protein [Almyronema epifaneia]|uniref:UPF0182 protein ACFVKH_14885 n=1 Tax=Almyronema epifaneia S1 TaxID=2991925 RepID=A0ABW6IH93_9CYAN
MNKTIQLRTRLLTVALVVFLALLLLSRTLVHFLTESWWFAATGFADVFWTRITWQVGIWLVTFLVYGLLLSMNYWLAMRLTRDRPFYTYPNLNLQPYAQVLPRYVAYGVIVLLTLSAASSSVSAWETILKHLNPTDFDQSDPIFGQDIGFYFFHLPFYEVLQRGLLGLVVWCMVLSIAVYAAKGEIRPERGWKYFLTGEAKTHLCILLAIAALTIAFGFWLKRYELLYSAGGVVFGAGYTDVHARLHAYWLMGFVTVAIAILFLVSLGRSGFSLPTVGIAFYLGVLLLVNGVYPWFQQKFVVEPNELEKERPYIENNIQFTRAAYDLDQVQTEDFPAEASLDRTDLANNQSTLDNIRLWDYRPLLSTYKQLQEIRLYYLFNDVDIDRYTLDGDYRQVMLAARELTFEEVPAQAQTWVNQRLKYTHGYGLVMSPVNQVTPNGLPELFIRDIPPESTVDLTVDQSSIYYGEETDTYIFTGTSTSEFDYPLGDENAFTQYQGLGGVPMGSWGRRLAYAFDFSSFKILISNYFTADSRVHYYRQILSRVRHIAPFLQFDSDPYISVIDGRLHWIIDAYTISDRYPYSDPLARNLAGNAVMSDNLRQIAQQNTNYMRDAVKVVIDAYDGTLQFFVVDEQDPVLATYRKIFPNLFISRDRVPATVKAHFRYPLDYFQAQAQMYQAYHMANSEVFYNREDLWRFPLQVYEDTQVQMQPYYIILRLPESEQEEFVLIIPFTPVNKDNMVAWMAARSDGDEYGRLLLYEFPKQELIYGPSQVDARIDQNPEISQQLTLWSQEGSRVIRGDLLVIPIQQSLLYVEPVYLRAEQGELPELKRVIIAYGDQTVMANNLAEALTAVFGTATPEAIAAAPAADSAVTPRLDPQLIQAALEAYQQGQSALQQGNWQRYGETQQTLENLLQQLNQQASEPAVSEGSVP